MGEPLHFSGLMLGGNIGSTESIFTAAKELLCLNKSEIIAESAIYISEPWGNSNQQEFLNQALLIKTVLDPFKLLDVIKKIEQILGRVQGNINGPRIIDIDIMYFDKEIIDHYSLQIPHPRMHNRNFNLIPLFEINPGWIHPVLGKTISELIQNSTDKLKVFKQNG